MSKNEPRSHAKHHLDHQIEEVRHDPYLQRDKPKEPALCPECGLVFHKGRWQRSAKPAGANMHLCPACHRIQDRYPAGFLTIAAPLLEAHRDEILRLVRNEEAREAAGHPLQRIMQIEEGKAGMVITTTDLHLARRLGESLHNAYQGKLSVQYSPNEYRVRVVWEN